MFWAVVWETSGHSPGLGVTQGGRQRSWLRGVRSKSWAPDSGSEGRGAGAWILGLRGEGPGAWILGLRGEGPGAWILGRREEGSGAWTLG